MLTMCMQELTEIKSPLYLVVDSCEVACEFWEWSLLGLLQEQQEFVSTEPVLHSP